MTDDAGTEVEPIVGNKRIEDAAIRFVVEQERRMGREAADTRYRGARSSVMVGRPFLHAHHLAFEHPGSGERMVLSAPLPPDLESVRERFS